MGYDPGREDDEMKKSSPTSKLALATPPAKLAREYREFEGRAAVVHRQFLESSVEQMRDFAATLTVESVLERPDRFLQSALLRATGPYQSGNFEIPRSRLAYACQVSEASIGRWLAGKFTPHPLMARSVLKVIAEVALEVAKERQEFAAEM
jgi:hypothetical protein